MMEDKGAYSEVPEGLQPRQRPRPHRPGFSTWIVSDHTWRPILGKKPDGELPAQVFLVCLLLVGLAKPQKE